MSSMGNMKQEIKRIKEVVEDVRGGIGIETDAKVEGEEAIDKRIMMIDEKLEISRGGRCWIWGKEGRG